MSLDMGKERGITHCFQMINLGQDVHVLQQHDGWIQMSTFAEQGDPHLPEREATC